MSNEVCGHVVIIGGGPSARAYLHELAEKFARGLIEQRPTKISVIEKSDEFGPGFPWSRKYNLDVHRSSLAEAEPRVRYGDRLIQQFHGLVNMLREWGVVIDLYPGREAVRVFEDRIGYRIDLSDETRIYSQFVILATGHWHGSSDVQIQGYHQSPWPATVLQQEVIGDSAEISHRHPKSVLILGTYLTGIDAAISIALAAGHFKTMPGQLPIYHGPEGLHIVLASRHGWLPKVWGRAPALFQPKVLTHKRLGQILRANENGGFIPLEALGKLFIQELIANDVDLGNIEHINAAEDSWPGMQRWLELLAGRLCIPSTRESLYADITAVFTGDSLRFDHKNANELAWQSVLFGLLPTISEAYPYLAGEDKIIFDRYIKTLYFNFAMPMSLAAASWLHALMASGVLEVRALGAEYHLAPCPKSSGMVLSTKTGPNGCEDRYFTNVINARGQLGNIACHPSILIQNMLSTGLIQPGLRPFRDDAYICNKGDAPGWFEERNESIEDGTKKYLVTGGIHVNPATCEVIPRCDIIRTKECLLNTGVYAMGPNVLGHFLDAQSVGHTARDADRIIKAIERKLRVSDCGGVAAG